MWPHSRVNHGEWKKSEKVLNWNLYLYKNAYKINEASVEKKQHNKTEISALNLDWLKIHIYLYTAKVNIQK